MQTTQPFRKCHLQILRSLYDGQVAGNDIVAIDCQDDGEKSANKSFMDDEDQDVNNSTDDAGSDMSDDANFQEEGELEKTVNNDVSSGHVVEHRS